MCVFLRQNIAGYMVRMLLYAFVNNVSGSVHMIVVRREGTLLGNENESYPIMSFTNLEIIIKVSHCSRMVRNYRRKTDRGKMILLFY